MGSGSQTYSIPRAVEFARRTHWFDGSLRAASGGQTLDHEIFQVARLHSFPGELNT